MAVELFSMLNPIASPRADAWRRWIATRWSLMLWPPTSYSVAPREPWRLDVIPARRDGCCGRASKASSASGGRAPGWWLRHGFLKAGRGSRPPLRWAPPITTFTSSGSGAGDAACHRDARMTCSSPRVNSAVRVHMEDGEHRLVLRLPAAGAGRRPGLLLFLSRRSFCDPPVTRRMRTAALFQCPP